MKVDLITFGNKQHIPTNHEQKQNQALIEIMKRVQAGETGPYRIDYYHGKETKITNIGKKNSDIFTSAKNILKNLFRK